MPLNLNATNERLRSNSSAAAKELLKALIMDPKNPGQCVLHLPSLSVKDGDDPRKLWVFGTVSTESGPKSIKVTLLELLTDWFLLGCLWFWYRYQYWA